jgi:hypothetical protein
MREKIPGFSQTRLASVHEFVNAGQLQVVRRETGFLGNARQHARADFLAVVKSEYRIGPAGP